VDYVPRLGAEESAEHYEARKAEEYAHIDQIQSASDLSELHPSINEITIRVDEKKSKSKKEREPRLLSEQATLRRGDSKDISKQHRDSKEFTVVTVPGTRKRAASYESKKRVKEESRLAKTYSDEKYNPMNRPLSGSTKLKDEAGGGSGSGAGTPGRPPSPTTTPPPHSSPHGPPLQQLEASDPTPTPPDSSDMIVRLQSLFGTTVPPIETEIGTPTTSQGVIDPTRSTDFDLATMSSESSPD